MKTCTKCGEEKPLDEYYKNKSKASGYENSCKKCVLARRAVHYAENREQILAYSADYRAANRDAIRERLARPEAKAQRAKNWANWYAVNRESVLEYQMERHSNNPHFAWENQYRIRAKKYGFEPVVESFTRDEVIARYGDSCFHCGGPFEELDHWPVPVCKGGHHSLESTRPSCQKCNWKSWRQSV